MPMTCAVCSLIGKGIDGSLLPFIAVYRGYSVCEEHLRLWEVNKGLEWDELVESAAMPIKVVAVDLSNLETDNEKHDAILEAVEEFNRKEPEPEEEYVVPDPDRFAKVVAEKMTEEPKPKKKRGRPKGKKSKKPKTSKKLSGSGNYSATPKGLPSSSKSATCETEDLPEGVEK